jgi:hypothetical protein
MMLNRDLRLALSQPSQRSKLLVVNPDINGNDYTRYYVSAVVDDGSFDDELFTIIEAMEDGKETTTTTGDIREGLARFPGEDEVLIFVPGWEGQEYAYFKIDSVRFNMDHTTTIILGDWRHGG